MSCQSEISENGKKRKTDLEQSQVPVIVVISFSCSISTAEKWTVFFMIAMSYFMEKKHTVINGNYFKIFTIYKNMRT